ncbi:MAG: glutamate-1-semialdehyde 2,1-aminomutase [Burkholderiales bacterium]|nr:glutamate-1-semialdehyde 2,1-aminomutase [Burkholderiales bacterium]
MQSLNFSKSRSLFEFGMTLMPGGVSSPGRAFSEVEMPPLIISSASGPYIYDVDGNRYTDFINGLGPNILGHADPRIAAAVNEQFARGTVYGACSEVEYQLAERIVGSSPSVEQIRFTCSGTEAVMSAVRLARAHTLRSIVVKFKGCYHGHADTMLALGSKPHMRASKSPERQGLSSNALHEVMAFPYNDLDDLQDTFRERGADIAAVIVEPVATNMGLVPPTPEFLEELRRLCTNHGALLIFDEVVSGFRLCYGSVSNVLGVVPDLITFGKIIGGGTPIGAFGGRRDLMTLLVEPGGVFQGGTFAGNAMSMAAGLRTLDILQNEGVYDLLEKLGALYEEITMDGLKRKDLPFGFVRRGSLFSYVLVPGLTACTSFTDVERQDKALFSRLHRSMASRGYLFPPTIEEPAFISAAHTEKEITQSANAAIEILAELYSSRSSS